jgi:hypothetical protein
MQNSLMGAAESPRAVIPKTSVPAAPIPLQIVQPVPIGRVRTEGSNRTVLETSVAIVKVPESIGGSL